MAASRNYSSTAGLMRLVGGITGAAASLVVDVTTGLPSVPFTLLLDPGLGVEEIATVTVVSGTTLTVTRGVGGTSAQAHDNGAEVRHAYYGQDFQDSRDHEANTTTAHGATGAVVGTTNTQTLTGKSMSGATNTFTAIPTTALDGGPLSGTNFHNSVSTKVTTNVGPTSGTAELTLITAPPVTGDAVKRFKITASFWCLSGSVNGDRFRMYLKGSSPANPVATFDFTVTNGTMSGSTLSISDVPIVGAQTYSLTILRVSGTGTATLNATPVVAGAPFEILVEQI